ncbi:MAG: Uma2 family endonuclease [Acidimicrobiales bacterium]
MAIAAGSNIPLGPLTYEDVQRFPDDGLRYELVDGELLVTPAPNTLHQRIVVNLVLLLHGVIDAGLEVLPAPVDWYIDQHTYFEPDVLVVRRSDESERRLEGTPVLAVEILSPTTRRRDLGLKKRAYEDAGLPWYWVVDPEAPSVSAFRLADGRYREEATVAGDEVYETHDPFAVRVVPSDLVL